MLPKGPRGARICVIRKRHVAPLGDAHRVQQRVGEILEGLRHLVRCLQKKLPAVVPQPLGIGERLGFPSVERQQPEASVLDLFVRHARIVFVFFLFFFRFRFCVGGKEGHLLAIRRPCKTLHTALSFSYGSGLAAVSTHGVDLLLFVAVRKESELFAVGRPARQEFRFR